MANIRAAVFFPGNRSSAMLFNGTSFVLTAVAVIQFPDCRAAAKGKPADN